MIKSDFSDLTLPKSKLYGIYRGVVENNISPDKDGRVQIRVFGIHCEEKVKTPITGIPTEELPWAEPATPIFGGISKVGIYGVPLQGAHVFLFFENGNPQCPRYFASAPGIPYSKPDVDKGFNDPDGVYPTTENLFQPDWSQGSSSSSVYPNNFVMETSCGHSIEMDSTPGEERILIKHGLTGSTIEFTKEGSILISSAGNTNKEATGSKQVTVGGDLTEYITGLHEEMTNDIKQTVVGSKTEFVAGSKTSTCLAKSSQKAEEIEINSTGDASSIAGGKNALIAGDNITIKSKERSVVMEAPIDVGIKGLISASITGNVLCDVKSLIKTTVEGKVLCDVKGLMTTVDGVAITHIKGGIIMIG